MEKKGVKKFWRTLAIIFILLNILLISFMVYAVHEYNKDLDNEYSCYYDICDVDNLDSPYYDYYYDSYQYLCLCYDEYNEIKFQTYLGR